MSLQLHPKCPVCGRIPALVIICPSIRALCISLKSQELWPVPLG